VGVAAVERGDTFEGLVERADSQASSSDEQAMKQIYGRSHLNTAALLLVIVGFGEPDNDVRAWYIGAEGVLRGIREI
jgi:hypothetical protein